MTVGRGRMVTGVMQSGDMGRDGRPGDEHGGSWRWRLKLRMLLLSDGRGPGEGDMAETMVLRLLVRPGDGGVIGVAGVDAHILLLRVLLLVVDDDAEELLPLELILRNLLKADILRAGGLEGQTIGA